MRSGALPVPPGIGSSSGNVSMFGMTQRATRAPPGLVIFGRRLIGMYGNGPERSGFTAATPLAIHDRRSVVPVSRRRLLSPALVALRSMLGHGAPVFGGLRRLALILEVGLDEVGERGFQGHVR